MWSKERLSRVRKERERGEKDRCKKGDSGWGNIAEKNTEKLLWCGIGVESFALVKKNINEIIAKHTKISYPYMFLKINVKPLVVS